MTVSLPEDLVKEIDEVIEKKRGYRSRPELIKEAVRRHLDTLKIRPRLEHLNTYDDRVEIIDNEANRMATVHIRDKKLYCGLCDELECIHTDYVWSLEDVAEQLREKGLKDPKLKSLKRFEKKMT